MYLNTNTTLTLEEKQMHIVDSHSVLKQNILEQERIIAKEKGLIAKYKLSYPLPLQQIVNVYGKVVWAEEVLKFLKELELELFLGETQEMLK